MSVFGDYFKKSLRWPLATGTGALALLVDGGASALDSAREHILWLRDQFMPELCDDEFLDTFAASRGIVRAPLETQEHFYGRVRAAYLWWARGGRASSIETALEKYFGFGRVTVESLRDEDAARWAEFRVNVEVVGTDLFVTQDQIEWAINENKPARSKLAETVFTYSCSGAVPLCSIGIQGAESVTVYPS